VKGRGGGNAMAADDLGESQRSLEGGEFLAIADVGKKGDP